METVQKRNKTKRIFVAQPMPGLDVPNALGRGARGDGCPLDRTRGMRIWMRECIHEGSIFVIVFPLYRFVPAHRNWHIETAGWNWAGFFT